MRMRLGGERGLGGRKSPQEAGPPNWLLAAGCIALALLVAGLVAGGSIGAMLVAWGYLTILTLATAFFCLLAIRQGRRWGG
jgi:hypothetical protein